VTAKALALALLAAAGVPPPASAEPPTALPVDASRRYRMEVAGEPVGVAVLRVRCRGDACTVRFETETRMPEAGGGGIGRRRAEADVDRSGRVRRGASSPAGPAAGPPAGTPPFASLLAETLLSSTPDGLRRCIDVVDGETGRTGTACAARRGAWLEGTVLGEPVRFRGRSGALPEEVLLPAQGARFAADPGAGVPSLAPRLLGVEVPAVPDAAGDRALAFCGVAAEPEDPEPPPRGVPRDFPEEGSCRERTAAYLASSRRDGIAGRHAVGVAWDGGRFVWHEWAELAVGGRWVPVDPSFRQVPASGPRFAIARFADGDEAARAEAGRRVLACWGRARVEPAGAAPARSRRAPTAR
jgi:hypothetical protein